MMSAKLYSNDLEGKVDEFIDNFNEFYAKPVKKGAKKAKEFVFNPKAYCWGAFYGTMFGSIAYFSNMQEDFSTRFGGAVFRFSASFLLGRQAVRLAQYLAKRIEKPVPAYITASVVSWVAWASMVYFPMNKIIGIDNIATTMAADAATHPFMIAPIIYLERKGKELHLVKDSVNYVKKKLKRGSDYQKL